MSSMPPENEEPDDIDALYRRWSAADSARPSGAAADAILANATALAWEAKRRSAQRRSLRQRRAIVFAGLAAAGFAGLLVSPLLFRPHPPAPPLTSSLDASVRQSPAPEAKKDSGAALAQSYAKPSPAAPMAGLADDLSMTARSRAAPPALSEAEPLAREVALQRAATLGDEAGLSSLLDQRVDVNSRDSQGRTPLMLAVIGGRENIVALLIAHGADPNARDAHGETPLHAALAARDARIAAALRRAGAR